MNRDRLLKVVVVGDNEVGKNCIFTKFKESFRKIPLEHEPTSFDNFSKLIEVDGIIYHLSVSYTTNSTGCDELRILSYPNTDVFLLCYAIDNRQSFENISSKWIPELKLHSPHTPIVLVATKKDKRNKKDADANYVSYAEGAAISKYMSAFVECSVKTGENLRAVFREAVRVALDKPKVTLIKCSLL
ncbi:ras-like GTP-binding protein RhoL [Daphnia pulex]|uniref:ras-like GTP-binding protein RhoL n=1 Tax=Daphnia pulex TaxID=6669 RepID=UPI001EDFD750|nr:ras-like GTP-binding protein RhoL [Daphnia pulex]